MIQMSMNTSKSKKNSRKKSVPIVLQPAEPDYSDEVKRWRDSNGNGLLRGPFYKVVNFLNSNDSRISQPKGSGVYSRGLCHMHFTKDTAVFYRYIDTKLHLVYILTHHKDTNRWKTSR